MKMCEALWSAAAKLPLLPLVHDRMNQGRKAAASRPHSKVPSAHLYSGWRRTCFQTRCPLFLWDSITIKSIKFLTAIARLAYFMLEAIVLDPRGAVRAYVSPG